MYPYNCTSRRKQQFEASDRRNVARERLGTFRKYWDSVLLVEDKETTTSFTSADDSQYTEYQDDLVTYEN